MQLDKSGIKQVFADLNRKFEEEEVQRRAASLGLPYFNLVGFPIDESALSLCSREEAEGGGAVPFFREGRLVKLGAIDHHSRILHQLLDRLAEKQYQVEVYLISRSGLDNALSQYKKIIATPAGKKNEVVLSLGGESLQHLRTIAGSEEQLTAISATDLVSLLISAAASMWASDIHIEPEKAAIKVRFRIDGVLQDIVQLPNKIFHLLTSRLKLLSSLKLNVTSMPQDGRFSVQQHGNNLDIRLSTLPTAFGESIVMRILGSQELELEIEKLGLGKGALDSIYQELKKPYGMILTTGPTGSGKTTTLYSFIHYLNKPGRKIITLEDPIEYQLEGIVQTPIDRKGGMNFATGLHSVLRQDPDIVMIGEIQDFDTAEIACQAALTGHTVFSTLHTNDAAGAVPRLLDLGIKPVTLAPALNALIAQRLVRKICAHCKQPYKPTPEELARVKHSLDKIPKQAGIKLPSILTFYHSPGCEQCHNIGYFGRIGVFEVLIVSDGIRKLMYNQEPAMNVKRQAISEGMVTMQQDGILKALSGITDLSEVWRVTEE